MVLMPAAACAWYCCMLQGLQLGRKRECVPRPYDICLFCWHMPQMDVQQACAADITETTVNVPAQSILSLWCVGQAIMPSS